MTNRQYRAFLDLLMVADPWPVEDEENHQIMIDMANDEAEKRGYTDWIDAYHEMPEIGNCMRRVKE